jgi:hypothetical protein
MTKIENIPPEQTPQVGRSHKPGSPKGPSFQKILEQQTDAQAEPTGQSQAAQLVPSPTVVEAKSIAITKLSPLQAKGLEHAERIIELLEQIDSCLAAGTLKKAAPLVKALEEEAQAIDPIRESLSANPQDETFGIIELAWGRAVGVSINFHRGDYIPIA